MSAVNYEITGTTPNAAGGPTIVGTAQGPLDDADALTLVVTTQGATGGTLDLELQVTFDGVNWMEWARFAQIIAGAAASTKAYTVTRSGQNSTGGTAMAAPAASPALTLGAGTFFGGPWGRQMRLVATAGAGTTAGATQTVQIYAQGPSAGHGH